MKIPWRKWRWFEPPSNFHGRQRWFRSQICVSSKFTRRCSSWKKHTRWVGHCWILRRGCGFSAWWGRSFAASTAGCDAASDSSGNTRQGADSRAGWAGVLEKTPVFFREVLSWFESTIFIKIHWEDVRFFDLFVMFRIFSLGWGQLFKTIPHGPVVPAVFFHHVSIIGSTIFPIPWVFPKSPGLGLLTQRDCGVPAAAAARSEHGPGGASRGGDVSLGGGGGEAADGDAAVGGPGVATVGWISTIDK